MLVILALCESHHLGLISSDTLLFEIGRIPDQTRKEDALAILKMAKETIKLTAEVEALVRKLTSSGLQPLDALHLASASTAKADYFCTCDDRFLRKAKTLDGLDTSVVSPTELVMELDA